MFFLLVCDIGCCLLMCCLIFVCTLLLYFLWFYGLISIISRPNFLFINIFSYFSFPFVPFLPVCCFLRFGVGYLSFLHQNKRKKRLYLKWKIQRKEEKKMVKTHLRLTGGVFYATGEWPRVSNEDLWRGGGGRRHRLVSIYGIILFIIRIITILGLSIT